MIRVPIALDALHLPTCSQRRLFLSLVHYMKPAPTYLHSSSTVARLRRAGYDADAVGQSGGGVAAGVGKEDSKLGQLRDGRAEHALCLQQGSRSRMCVGECY